MRMHHNLISKEPVDRFERQNAQIDPAIFNWSEPGDRDLLRAPARGVASYPKSVMLALLKQTLQ